MIPALEFGVQDADGRLFEASWTIPSRGVTDRHVGRPPPPPGRPLADSFYFSFCDCNQKHFAKRPSEILCAFIFVVPCCFFLVLSVQIII